MRSIRTISVMVIAILCTPIAACDGSASYTTPVGLFTITVDASGHISVAVNGNLTVPDVGTFTLSDADTINPVKNETMVLVGQHGSSTREEYTVNTGDTLYAWATGGAESTITNRKITFLAAQNQPSIIYVSTKPFKTDPCLTGTWAATSFSSYFPDGQLFSDHSAGKSTLHATGSVHRIFSSDGTGSAMWDVDASGNVLGGPYSGKTVSYSIRGSEAFTFKTDAKLHDSVSSTSITLTWHGQGGHSYAHRPGDDVMSYLCEPSNFSTVQIYSGGRKTWVAYTRISA